MTSLKHFLQKVIEYQGPGCWIYTRRNFGWAYDRALIAQLPTGIRLFCRYVRMHNWLIRTPTIVFGHGLFHTFRKLDKSSNEPYHLTINGRDVWLDLSDPGSMWALKELSLGSIQTRLIEKLVQSADMFIDVGANQGIFSAVASAKLPAAGELVAIEPQAALAQCIRLTLQSSGLQKWSVIESVVAEAIGEASLNVPAENRGEAHISEDGSSTHDQVVVRATTLDHLLGTLPQGKRVVLKIDVEGAELLALRGGRNFLSRTKPALIMEVNPEAMLRFGYAPSAVATLLCELGYQDWAFIDDPVTRHPISDLPQRYCDVVLVPA